MSTKQGKKMDMVLQDVLPMIRPWFGMEERDEKSFILKHMKNGFLFYVFCH